MANATLNRVPPDPITTITLEMSLLEAQTLRSVLDSIGGDPRRSLRCHTDAINNTLYKAGVVTYAEANGLSYWDVIDRTAHYGALYVRPIL